MEEFLLSTRLPLITSQLGRIEGLDLCSPSGFHWCSGLGGRGSGELPHYFFLSSGQGFDCPLGFLWLHANRQREELWLGRELEVLCPLMTYPDYSCEWWGFKSLVLNCPPLHFLNLWVVAYYKSVKGRNLSVLYLEFSGSSKCGATDFFLFSFCEMFDFSRTIII